MQEIDFWRSSASNQHINPRFLDAIDEAWIYWYSDLDVIDFGCGIGRFTGYFRPDRYLGYDINSKRIKTCRHRYPHYQFTDKFTDLPPNKVLFMYTVALHMNDDQLIEAKQALTPYKVIICESLDNPSYRGWSGLDEIACYRRTVEDYERIFNKTGRVTFTADLVGGDYQINFLELD